MRLMALLAALALLAGCTDDAPSDDGMDPGDGDDEPEPMEPENGTEDMDEEPRQTVQVTVTWSGVFMVNGEYDEDTVRVPANSTVELTFVNDEQNPTVNHDLVVENIEGASTDIIGPGETSDPVTFDVGGPMETAFFCSVGNHRENGMEGTFIVE